MPKEDKNKSRQSRDRELADMYILSPAPGEPVRVVVSQEAAEGIPAMGVVSESSSSGGFGYFLRTALVYVGFIGAIGACGHFESVGWVDGSTSEPNKYNASATLFGNVEKANQSLPKLYADSLSGANLKTTEWTFGEKVAQESGQSIKPISVIAGADSRKQNQTFSVTVWGQYLYRHDSVSGTVEDSQTSQQGHKWLLGPLP